MLNHDDAWSYKHDLALILVGLAYGTDHELSDGELDAITETLEHWQPLGPGAAREVALEALVVYREGHAAVTQVVESMRTLRDVLDPEARARVLEQVVRLAEADGLLLHAERSLIATLGDVWEMKVQARDLLDDTTADEEAKPEWSLMHDIALVYVVLAHSTDGELTEREIRAILDRLGEWQPELDDDEVRRVAREALAFYSQEPSEEALRDSVAVIRDLLPTAQRLSILDDLSFIADVEGDAEGHKEEMLHALAGAWSIGIRLDGSANRRGGAVA